MLMLNIVKSLLIVLSKCLTNSLWSKQPVPCGRDLLRIPLLVLPIQSKQETKFWFMRQLVELETWSFRLQRMQVTMHWKRTWDTLIELVLPFIVACAVKEGMFGKIVSLQMRTHQSNWSQSCSQSVNTNLCDIALTTHYIKDVLHFFFGRYPMDMS